MKKVCVLVYLFFYAPLCFADLPGVSHLWRLYDEKEYSKLLSDIYLLKSVVPEAFIPEVYFLEAVMAHQLGYPTRVISLKEIYARKYLNQLDQFQTDQQRKLSFFGVRLLSLALEDYRKYLFSDEEISKISFSPRSKPKEAPSKGDIIQWKISKDTEIWKDEIPSLVLNDLKSLKMKLTEEPGVVLTWFKKMVEEGLQSYEKGILKRDFFYERFRLQILDIEFDLKASDKKRGFYVIFRFIKIYLKRQPLPKFARPSFFGSAS
jgi:hypothetical protein